MKQFYRRKLPHLVPAGATLFITFRLAASLPADVIANLRAERQAAQARLAETILDNDERLAAALALNKRLFARFDNVLDRCQHSAGWLRQPDIGAMVAAELHRLA